GGAVTGRAVPAALLARAFRDPLPVQRAALGALRIEPDDAESGRDRPKRTHAELGRFLHDEIHRFGFRQSLHERQLELRLRQRIDEVEQLELAVRAAERRDRAVPLLSASIERDDAIAGPTA